MPNAAKSENLEWCQPSGKGHILDYIVICDARIRAFRAEQPVNLTVVTMDEDPGINCPVQSSWEAGR